MARLKKKWERFEELVKDIQKELLPQNAIVTPGEKIRGRRTGKLREIDIAVRVNAGQYSLLIAIDCKDYSRPVGVREVGSVMELFDDVGANQGVIVAPHGFTDTAKKRAADAGTRLLRPVDTRSHDWKTEVRIPTVAKVINMDVRQLSFTSSGPVLRPIFDATDLELYEIDVCDESGVRLGTPLTLVRDAWDDGTMEGCQYSPGNTGALTSWAVRHT